MCRLVAGVLLNDASPNKATRFKPENEPDERMSDATASNATSTKAMGKIGIDREQWA